MKIKKYYNGTVSVKTFSAIARTMLLLLLLFCPVSPAAAGPWTLYDRTGGLAHNGVQVIARDPGGVLWIGTRGGLSRFDGGQWTTLSVADGLPDDDVNSIFFDARGDLWLGTRKGFGFLRDGRWNRFGLPGAAEGEKVYVAADREGAVWFGYGGGLLRFDEGEGTLGPVPEMEGRSVTALMADREGRLWAGTPAGVSVYDGYRWKDLTDADGLPPGAVRALLEDREGSVWLGTEAGLSEYDGVSWETVGEGDDLPDSRITALAEDRQGRIWVGTEGGTGWYDGYDWVWLGREQGIPDANIRAVVADLNGSIWIGTEGGVVKFDTSWTTLGTLGYAAHRPRAPLLLARRGTVFLGTAGGFLEKEGRRVELMGEGAGVTGTVRAFAEDGEGNLWAGTDNGLYRYDGYGVEQYLPPPEVRETVRTPHGYEAVAVRSFNRFEGLKSEVVTALWAGEEEEGVWVGTTAGLSRFDGRQWDLLDEGHELYGAEITALTGGAGEFWVGGTDGLWSLREGEWHRSGKFARRRVTALFLDRQGRLWVGTEGGLVMRDGDRWQAFGEKEGLLGKSVSVVFEDRSGVMWIGTEAGVAKFDGVHWGFFSEVDGLHANAVTSIIEIEEELWFASAEGVSAYRPDRAPPDTRIKNPPREVVAAASCLFEFAGGDYETAAHELKYSWKLDDSPWTPFSGEALAEVEGLPNGTHSFSVRSMDKGLNVDPTPATAVFEVDTGLFDLELVEAEVKGIYASLYQFYASDPDYDRRPVATVRVKNRYDETLKVNFGLFIPGLMDFPTHRAAPVPPGDEVVVPLGLEMSEAVLSLDKTTTRQALLTMQYSLRGELKEASYSQPVTIFEKHTMVWEEPGRVGLYVTHLDEAVERFARQVVRQFREDEKRTIIYDNLLRGIELFDALGTYGVRYIADPENPYGGIAGERTALDFIRLPRETLLAKAGDCDDVAVLYAAMLQNIGIDTALVDVFDHVFVMFDTGLRKRQSGQLTKNLDLLHVDDLERIWIPVEVTLLGRSFTEAWRTGARMLRERKFAVIEMKEAWRKYAPLQLPSPAAEVAVPTREQVLPLFTEDLRLQEENLVSDRLRRLQYRVDADPADWRAVNSMGVLLAANGYLTLASEKFLQVVEMSPDFPGGYSNLGNVRYEQERYGDATELYKRALALEPQSPEVHVELALTYCELGQFGLAKEHYMAAMQIDPELGRAGGGAGARE